MKGPLALLKAVLKQDKEEHKKVRTLPELDKKFVSEMEKALERIGKFYD